MFFRQALQRIQCVLGLRFLPFRFQRWLLCRATRVVECINFAGFVGYGLVFAIDGRDLYYHHIFHKFRENVPLSALIFCLLMLAIAQFFSMLKQSAASDLISGVVLIVSGIAWAMVAAAFAFAYPPLNTDLVFPSIMMLVCMVAGNNLIDYGLDGFGEEQ